MTTIVEFEMGKLAEHPGGVVYALVDGHPVAMPACGQLDEVAAVLGETAWLSGQLNRIGAVKFRGLPVIKIDAVPPMRKREGEPDAVALCWLLNGICYVHPAQWDAFRKHLSEDT